MNLKDFMNRYRFENIEIYEEYRDRNRLISEFLYSGSGRKIPAEYLERKVLGYREKFDHSKKIIVVEQTDLEIRKERELNNRKQN